MEGQGFYRWQFYLRAAVLNPLCLEFIVSDFWSRFGEDFLRNPFQIVGVEAASVPIITAIVLDFHRRGLPINAFTIRREQKLYGMRNLIEGIPNSDPVLFVDDLTSPQHTAFWHAVNVISLYKLTLDDRAFVLMRKQQAKEPPKIRTSIGKVIVESIFTLDDFTLLDDA